MRLSTRIKVVGTLIVAFLILSPAVSSLGSSPTASTTAILQVMPGRYAVLRADPTDNLYHVAPPLEFWRAGIQSIQMATINVNYIGAWTAPAQTAFQYAVDIWETQITSSVPISVSANWTALGPGILGSAGPVNFFRDFPGAPAANTWYPSALANKLRGVDLDPSNADIDANFSSSFPNWYFGTDGNTPPGQYDFVSVVLHELGHGLGFLGSMTVSSGQGSWGGGTGFPFTYDRFAENGANQSLIDTSLFPNPSAALAAQLTSGNIFFDGPNARAANGGNRAQLYAPGTWSQGSSYAHLDEIYNNTVNALMTFSLSTAESIHNPGPIMLGIFQDMGWTTVASLPDLSIVKQVVGGANRNPGDPVTFTLSIQNVGALTATSVIVTDTLSGNILSPTWTQSSLAGTTVQSGTLFVWNLPDLPAGASGVISVSGAISPSLPPQTMIPNTATISTASAETSVSNNSSSVTVIVSGIRIYLPVVSKNYTPPAQWATLISEDFEGSFPSPWDVFDNDGATNGTYNWGKRNCQVYAGSSSGWAVGGGADGVALGCGSNYPDNADSWMVYGPFSLVGATAGELNFKLWLNSEAGFDGVCRLASINDTDYYGFCESGDTSGWIDRTLDLSNVTQLGNLLGQPNVWVALIFVSDGTLNFPEGGYVDNIVLRKCTATACADLSSAVPESDKGQIVDVPVKMTLPK